MSTAISDFGTKLYVEGTTAGKYHELVAITSAPATGAAPKGLDATTLSDSVEVQIPGRQSIPNFKFEYFYNKADFQAVVAAVSLTADKNYLIVYQDGSGVKFSARGSTFVDEVSKDKTLRAELNLIVTAPPEYVPDTASLMEAAG